MAMIDSRATEMYSHHSSGFLKTDRFCLVTGIVVVFERADQFELMALGKLEL
jgi:hypothetical protein